MHAPASPLLSCPFLTPFPQTNLAHPLEIHKVGRQRHRNQPLLAATPRRLVHGGQGGRLGPQSRPPCPAPAPPLHHGRMALLPQPSHYSMVRRSGRRCPPCLLLPRPHTTQTRQRLPYSRANRHRPPSPRSKPGPPLPPPPPLLPSPPPSRPCPRAQNDGHLLCGTTCQFTEAWLETTRKQVTYHTRGCWYTSRRSPPQQPHFCLRGPLFRQSFLTLVFRLHACAGSEV